MSYKDTLRARAIKNTTGKVSHKLAPHQIILAPMFTEKTVAANEDHGVFVFKVHRDANKIDVKNAIQALYDVDVANVRVMRIGSKGRAHRKLVRKAYKKAVITLQGDKTIELVS
ncbi:MAG: 50S ribosomal protein L23 [Candidatus Peribacteria bacterium]|nr:MAG: 50S ribosomal protein L23 [Candidatus Peribacteria bacterium]